MSQAEGGPETWKEPAPTILSNSYRGGHGGVLNTATPQKKLTNTASPQEKSTKHRHRKSKRRIFSKKSKKNAVINVTRQRML